MYYTERTPHETVRLIEERLADKNNRYHVETPRKLVLSSNSYGYEEAQMISSPKDNWVVGEVRGSGSSKERSALIRALLCTWCL